MPPRKAIRPRKGMPPTERRNNEYKTILPWRASRFRALHFPNGAVGAATTGLTAGFAVGTGVVGLTGVATGGVTGVVTGGVAGWAAVTRALQQASQRLFLAEHAGQSVKEPLAVVAPQLPHLPRFMTNCLLAQLAQSPAFAEEDTSTVANDSNIVVIPYVRNRFIRSPFFVFWFRF